MASLRLHSVLFVLFAASCTGCKPASGSDAPIGSHGRAQAQDADFTAADSHSPAPAEAPAADARPGERFEAELRDEAVAQRRPGLGTEYGEQRRSSIVTRQFTRGHSEPDVVLSILYDDLEGIRARRGGGLSNTTSRVSTPEGMLALTIVDEHGRVIPAAQIGSKRFAMGELGQRYRIGVSNGSAQRFEIVASVDGLDVMDGGEAGFAKRGYILEPLSSVMIEGWRTSHETVAAFRFTSIDESYADRTGRARNIGVIGVAFFHEEGSAPLRELRRRESADPFPNRFAPPPPPRRVVF
jgi:hypothetical protein